jgi:hypothetical protein
MGHSMRRRVRRSRCARSGRGSLSEPDVLDDAEPDFTPDDFDDSYIGANAWAPECDLTEADYLEEEDV